MYFLLLWLVNGVRVTPKFLVFCDGELKFNAKNSYFTCISLFVSRSIRKWWLALPPNKKQLFREWTWRRRWHLVGAGTGLLFFVSICLLTHLDESPVTGRTRLLLFSRENFMELARVTGEAVRTQSCSCSCPHNLFSLFTLIFLVASSCKPSSSA